MVFTKATQLKGRLDAFAPMPLPGGALMVSPEHFTVEYVINPHMEGHVGTVDPAAAWREWEGVKAAFEAAGTDVQVVPGRPGLPDMVFCANQSLPGLDAEGRRAVLMSRMHADPRKDEVAWIEQWYRQNGYLVHHFPEGAVRDFEGMGDALWHPGRRLIWGGYGFRSSLEAYQHVSSIFDVPVVALELLQPAFYHLDTCLCLLDERTALYYPGAFTSEGIDLLKALIPDLIEVGDADANDRFACNACSPNGRDVVLHPGSAAVVDALTSRGFTVHETPTNEFLKSGGSVFCMKMMVW